MDGGTPPHTDRRWPGAWRGANKLRAGAALLPAAGGAGRRMVPVRGRPAALVGPSLFSPLRRPGRLLPQEASPCLLATLPALVPVVPTRRGRAGPRRV